MLSLSKLGFLLTGVGFIIGALEVVFITHWSPKLVWGFLGAAGVCFVLVFFEVESHLHRSPAA